MGEGTVAKLQRLHPSPARSTKIVLRRSEGPLDGCIAFHVDGGHASSTVQVTLNDDSEYQGGRLCFYAPDVGLQTPRRSAGTVTVHPREQMHGVTRLVAGKRYSLFVVDEANGLGDKGVFLVQKDVFSLLCPPSSGSGSGRGRGRRKAKVLKVEEESDDDEDDNDDLYGGKEEEDSDEEF